MATADDPAIEQHHLRFVPDKRSPLLHGPLDMMALTVTGGIPDTIKVYPSKDDGLRGHYERQVFIGDWAPPENQHLYEWVDDVGLPGNEGWGDS